MAEKRKTITSSEVKKRYNDKTYRQYLVSFRVDQDAELIELIENLKKDGYSTTDAFRKIIKIAYHMPSLSQID